MAMSRSTAILVAGMHRSGTSALTGVLDKLAIPLGANLLEPGRDNPKGYWEHRDVVAVHERLLSGLGSRWDDVRALPRHWQQSEPAQLALAALGEIISRDFSGEPLWAVKDPRLCRFLPLWFQALQLHETRSVVLFVVRRPSEVSASIEARNHWHPLVGKLLWLRYMTEAVAASRDVPRAVVLYDDLLADPVTTVTTALAILGVAVGEGLLAQSRAAIAGFVEASDRHHQSLGPEGAQTTLDESSRKLYESFVGVAHGLNDWGAVEQATAGFDQAWSAEGACVDAVADMSARIDTERQAAKLAASHATSALNAQIRWSEDAVEKQEALQVENAELSSKLRAQIRWSEDSVEKQEALQVENAELSSKLHAQIRCSEDSVEKQEALQVENAELSSKLHAQIRWSEEAQAAHEALEGKHGEVASRLSLLAAEHARLITEFNALHEGKLALDAELQKVYQSRSWKLTKPLRFAAKPIRRQAAPTNSSTRKPE